MKYKISTAFILGLFIALLIGSTIQTVNAQGSSLWRLKTGFLTPTTNRSLDINGTGTSTFNNGIDISAGCFAVSGVCITGGGGGGGGVAWGAITGTLSDQTDLQNALNLKIDNSTTTLPNITTLANLSIVESQISDLVHYDTDDFNTDFLATTSVGFIDLVLTGNLTIPDDGLFASDNTNGNIWVADGTNFNSVLMSGDATIASDGTVTVLGATSDTMVMNAKVNEASGIAKCKVVYISGATGSFAQVSLASRSDFDTADVIAISNETKTDGQTISITSVGLVENCDTSAFSPGDIVHLGDNGDFVVEHATGTDAGIRLGNVVKSNGSTGSILFNVTPSTIIGSVAGTLRDSLVNTSADPSAISARTAINDVDDFVSFGILGSGATGEFDGGDSFIFANGSGLFRFTNDGTEGFEWRTDETGTSNIFTNTAKMRLLGTGELGIGTTSPSSLLTVGSTSTQQFLVSDLGVITDGVWNASQIDISDYTNLAGDAEIVLTDDTLSIASTIARDSELHSALTTTGTGTYVSLASQLLTIDPITESDITDLTHTAGPLTTEQVQDISGGMVTGNTETLITVTYQDGDGTLDFVVDPVLSNYTDDLTHTTAIPARLAGAHVMLNTNTFDVDDNLSSYTDDLTHTTDTNANTICTGTGNYLDGEGNCDALITNATHTGDVTGAGALSIASNVIIESDFLINTPTNGYVLTASSTATGGFSWEVIAGGGTVTSVAQTVPTGFTIAGSPITGAGTLAIAFDTGYSSAGLFTASTTNWNNFFDTPSTQITAGTGLSWTSNTLNATELDTLQTVFDRGTSITIADTDNQTLFITQNDTTNNPDALSITQNSTGDAIELIGNSTTGTLFNAYTNAIRTSGVVFNLNDDNASSVSTVFNISSDGSGTALNIDGTGTGYSAIFNNGNVGIGDTSPASLLTVGTGDAFQVNNSGTIVAGSWNATTIDIGSYTNLTVGSGITLTNDTLTVSSAGGLAQTTGGLTTTGVLEDINTTGANSADSEFLVGTGAGALTWETGATARTSLGVDPIGTDNSTDVTLTGSLDYLTLTGQAITRGAIDLTTDVSGILPIANGGTGNSTALSAFNALKQTATTIYEGVIELATDAETFTGTSATRAMTPSNLSSIRKVVYKTTDETLSNSTTMQNDNELLFAIGQNEVWAISISIVTNGSSVSDFKGGWSVPTGSTMTWYSVAVQDDSVFSESGTDTVTLNGGDEGSFWIGTVFGGSTAGNVNFQWAQNTAEVFNTQVLTGSYLIADRLE